MQRDLKYQMRVIKNIIILSYQFQPKCFKAMNKVDYTVFHVFTF